MKNLLFLFLLLAGGTAAVAQPVQTLYHKNGKKYMEGHWTFTKRSLMPQVADVESDRGTNERPYDADETDLYQTDAEEQFQRNGQPLHYPDPAEFLSLLCEGPITYWYANGAKQLEITYKSGVPNGPFAEYYADSRMVLQKGNITNGMPDGPWTYYYKSGKPFYTGTYKAYSQEELKKFWAWDEGDYENRSDPEGTNKESLYVGGENKGLELSQPFFRFYGMFLPNAQKQGRFQFWDKAGKPWAELEFDSDRPVGIWKVWHEGFKGPAIVLEWERGKISFITDTAGKRRSRAELRELEIQDRKARAEAYRTAANKASGQNATPQRNDIFTLVDQMPQFPGDIKAWIEERMKYPPAAKKEGVGGRVIVKFTVHPDGSLTDAVIQKPGRADLDAEALRLVNAMPKWEPGRQNGKAVTVYNRVWVEFKLP